jgi:hypothetical protein
MSEDNVSITKLINAPADTIFGILADPAKHAAIDGTGWVREPVDGHRLTRKGQIFRMAMYHPNANFPIKTYETANRIVDYAPPLTISWETGHDPAGDGNLEFGGWFWRYDLRPIDQSRTQVKLSYDWSAVPQEIRDRIGFPPFGPDHLDNSLTHLAELAAAAGH